MAEIVIRQNPKYQDGVRARKYFVEVDGSSLGARNKYGIISMKPREVLVEVNSFPDKKSLGELIEFLTRRKCEIKLK